ncbi:GAF domain-containing protein [Pedobacter nutrimenti]|uniref:GAF domain-containing protein n=1 Tax=Pedobacter nutrimenti TaxID=1241337 RepID=UPI00293063CC|nr:GAF domain-containing protein [Pedobacter nutrimenti]
MTNQTNTDLHSANEIQRIAALQRYKLITTSADAFFDRIVQHTAEIFEVPMALISLVDLHEVFFKATVGADGILSIPREKSLCTIAILNSEPMILNYGEKEKCLLSTSIIAGEYGLKFYASVPLIEPSGLIIGTLSITDKKTRTFSEDQVNIMKDLASLIMKEMNSRLK